MALIAALMGALLLALPAAASAATTCDFASGVLSVSLPADDDRAELEVAVGGEIVVSNGPQLACAGTGGPPTVTNTNAISVSATAGFTDVAIHAPGRFAPGANTVGENGGTPEIEIFVNLNDQVGAGLFVNADPLGDSIRFGSGGINPNLPSEDGFPDADIFLTGVPLIVGSGGAGPDDLGAQGGGGTGGALAQRITLSGNGGADILTGGDGGDVLLGGIDDNTLSGMDGDDFLLPAPHNDTMDGGPGTDQAFYLGHSSGISVDLAIAGPQNTGGSALDSLVGVEDVVGTDFADVLRGDDETNALTGVDGNDVLEGRGGVDRLEGRGGKDALDVRDGGPDEAFCGSGIDTVTADAPGIDTLTDCDDTVFPVVDPPATPPGEAPPSGTQPAAAPPPAIPPADTTPPALSRVALSSRRFRLGTTFRYTLSEAATVRIAIERAGRGVTLRRGGRLRCEAATRANRRRLARQLLRITAIRRLRGQARQRALRRATRRRACTAFRRMGTLTRRNQGPGAVRTRFSGRLGQRRLRPARYRARLIATDGAGNRSAERRLTFRVVRR